MGSWVEGRWSWALNWRRNLLDREKEMENELLNLIMGVELVEGVEDYWKWNGAASGMFVVKEAYKELIKEKDMTQPSNIYHAAGALAQVWRGAAPLKAKIMAWRLIWDRLPTGDNLEKRVQLRIGESNCKCCSSVIESAEHLFLLCKEVVKLWQNMVKWIGVVWVAPRKIQDHFLSFSGLLGGRRSRRSLGDLWICIVWVVWNWRNKVCFEGRPWDFRKIEEEIKCRFWSWIMIKEEMMPNCSFADWAKKPLCEFLNSL